MAAAAGTSPSMLLNAAGPGVHVDAKLFEADASAGARGTIGFLELVTFVSPELDCGTGCRRGDAITRSRPAVAAAFSSKASASGMAGTGASSRKSSNPPSFSGGKPSLSGDESSGLRFAADEGGLTCDAAVPGLRKAASEGASPKNSAKA
eukprot:CAMPEP_0178436460 /NCGR_PEP_ID=MMETSP0689_2-20121128/34451_1 /TAXON_ID=160604 /ORGANISM="Amphidinium massartii, Strain CS-259" /LENGTH=149 /DNA_ID=CAMNT_0020058557 /DNA_START=320 /DNA_END=765 /DNA_ORIENTATION=+